MSCRRRVDLPTAALGAVATSCCDGWSYINVLLAVFNMVPVPPLDGGNVLAGCCAGRRREMFDRLRPYGFMILYGLMFTGVL